MSDIENECRAASCRKEATHTANFKVHWEDGRVHEDSIPYCLEDVLYFASWLPYVYPDRYELVEILPPASEMFGDD